MILIALGTSEFQFNRLLEMVDRLCDEGVIDGSEVVAQCGCSTYQPRNYQSFSLIARDDFQKYMDDAVCVITHGGTGCVVPALKQGKKVIAVPREAQYGEHVDNHQFDLVDSFCSRNLILKACDYDSLKSSVCGMPAFNPRQFKSNSCEMNRLIMDFIAKGQ